MLKSSSFLRRCKFLVRIVRSFRIDKDFFKEVKQYCQDLGTDFTTLITDLLHNELDRVNNINEDEKEE